jgi:polyhydroxybutyrate depolymerase
MAQPTLPRPAVTVAQKSLALDGRDRSFLVVAGRQRQPNPALVLMLHGTMQTARNIRPFAGYSFDSYAVDGGVVVIYPDAVHRDWNGARKAVMLRAGTKQIDDVGFIRAIIEYAVAAEGVDPSKVYVAGFSLGGQMTLRLIHETPELFAGAAVLSANMPAPDNLTIDHDARLALPVLTIHGTADPLAPFDGGIVGFHGHLPKGMHLSARQTAEYFANRNGITGPPSVTPLAHKAAPGDTTSVTRYDYTCSGAPPVRFYAIQNGGHVLPNPRHTSAAWFWGRSTDDLSPPTPSPNSSTCQPHHLIKEQHHDRLHRVGPEWGTQRTARRRWVGDC